MDKRREEKRRGEKRREKKRREEMRKDEKRRVNKRREEKRRKKKILNAIVLLNGNIFCYSVLQFTILKKFYSCKYLS